MRVPKKMIMQIGGNTVVPPIIDIDHETNDLSQYTTTVTDGGRLSVTAGAALNGTNFGLQSFINSTTPILATKTLATPSTTGVVEARVYIDPNTLTMANLNEFTVLQLFSSTPATIGYILLAMDGGLYKIQQIMMLNTGSNYAAYFAITDAPHYLEIKLTRASSVGATDGSMQLWIDGVLKETLTGANYTKFSDFSKISLGATQGIDAGTSGTFFMDELIVNNTGGLIGA